MKLRVFSVFDTKAQAYLPPFFMHRQAMAERAFSQCVQSAEHQFGKSPHDFTLFDIGEFDDERGTITPTDPRSLGNGLEYLFEREEEDAFKHVSISRDPESGKIVKETHHE